MKRLFILCLPLMVMLPKPCFPWGHEGHKIVAEIAWRHLTPAARDSTVSLLELEDAESLADICTWADEVRRTTHPYTYGYHFVNIPAGVDGFDMSRDCGDPENHCIVWAIEHYGNIFQDVTAVLDDRLEALKFLVHFVADIHQPLHCGRLEDRGGNSIKVMPLDSKEEVRLHGYWDYVILEQAGLVWPGTLDSLGAEIEQMEDSVGTGVNPVDWANESYRLCEDYVYNIPKDGHVDEAYNQRAIADIKKRLIQAGLRLALVLNTATQGELSFD